MAKIVESYDLKNAAKECMDMLFNLGIPYTEPKSIKVNPRYKKWGACKMHTTEDIYGACLHIDYHIEINPVLLDKRNGKYGLYETLLHELIHTCPNCFNHGKLWSAYARKVNKAYGYEISRVSSARDKKCSEEVIDELNRKNKAKIKYVIACKKCGKIVDQRKSANADIVKRPWAYRHKNCGGECYLKENRSNNVFLSAFNYHY